ncbi:MAG: endonuclease/exonuclease/phosphatase family protein [Patescibacteria group bacterium]|jgi:endonuclease/exonuclease/phosphatase family metal-dependent hydrolase
MHIKLLQWNILFDEKYENILRELKKINADVLCLEEATTQSPVNRKRHVADDLARALGMHVHYGRAGHWEGRHFGNAVLSRFPIVKRRMIPLKIHEAYHDTPEYIKRGYVEATLNIRGKRLAVGVTHLAFRRRFHHTPVKVKEADRLMEIVRKRKKNYILCGDMNALPQSYTIRHFKKCLVNAGPPYREKSFTTIPFTFEGWHARRLHYRVDYCFTTPDIRVKTARFLGDVKASDHLPILIELEV